MATAPPTINALPAPPDPNDRSTFNARAYPWSVAQQTLATQANAVASNVYANAQDASTSASTAAGSASTAATAAANLAGLDALWLGSAASDPTTGKSGAPLVAGNAYVSTSTGLLRAYNGTLWVNGVGTVSGVTSLNAATGDLVLKTLNGAALTGVGDIQVGYLNIPQNSKSANYTVVLSDAGKHLLHPSADTIARTFTIPANASVAFPIGTALTFVNQVSAGVLTISITTDTMRLAGAGTTGSRTLTANGLATAIKLTATEWIISGNGLS